jgi:hypothetical protein
MKKMTKKILSITLGMGAISLATVSTVYANPNFNQQATFASQTSQAFGVQDGRHGVATANDFHTPSWDRFSFNYEFHSGPNWRHDLGQPTTWQGAVPVDVFSVNMRRDANVSRYAPGFGIFSAELQTAQTNPFFSQPPNPHFHNAWEITNPNVIPNFDTQQLGVNFQPAPQGGFDISTMPGNSGGMLPSTSIGIN